MTVQSFTLLAGCLMIAIPVVGLALLGLVVLIIVL